MVNSCARRALALTAEKVNADSVGRSELSKAHKLSILRFFENKILKCLVLSCGCRNSIFHY